MARHKKRRKERPNVNATIDERMKRLDQLAKPRHGGSCSSCEAHEVNAAKRYARFLVQRSRVINRQKINLDDFRRSFMHAGSVVLYTEFSMPRRRLRKLRRSENRTRRFL